MVGFHAQQAVEKAIKAVLASCGDELFPAESVRLVVVLQGARLDDVRWDPRLGPDQERSGVLGVGRDAASRLGADERLEISRIEGGILLR